jgi:hypothetical protein
VKKRLKACWLFFVPQGEGEGEGGGTGEGKGEGCTWVARGCCCRVSADACGLRRKVVGRGSKEAREQRVLD